MLKLSGLESLKDRRTEMFRVFVVKSYKSGLFDRWYQQRESAYGLRNPRVIEEAAAKKVRTFKAPLYEARRVLNVELQLQGQT